MQFSYPPPGKIRRVSLQQTAGGVVRQTADQMFDEDILISWECRTCEPSEWVYFQGLQTDEDPTYRFVGYWGDEYDVKLHTLDPARVKGRLFDVSGSFQVISVISWASV